ncbi:hypothetical protein [Labilibaculum antarcticum]|nr:hypothetical protein [Labilibaculum antarcticum]
MKKVQAESFGYGVLTVSIEIMADRKVREHDKYLSNYHKIKTG